MASQVAHGGGMPDQKIDGVADEIGRRLVSGVEKENAIVDELELREPLAFAAGRDKIAGGDELGEYLRRIARGRCARGLR